MLLLLSGCDDPRPAPPPRPGLVATHYRFEAIGPAFAWPEADGRWFVRFRWRLGYHGPTDVVLASADQRLSLETDAGTLAGSTHPTTLAFANGTTSQVMEAMYYQPEPGGEPSSFEAVLELRGQPVGRQPLEKKRVAMSGLSFTLGPAAKLGAYAGRPNEPSATTLAIEVAVENETKEPIRFSPFDLQGESGGRTWKYHHEGSHHELIVIEPSKRESVKQVLAQEPDTQPGTSVEVRYLGAPIGPLPVVR